MTKVIYVKYDTCEQLINWIEHNGSVQYHYYDKIFDYREILYTYNGGTIKVVNLNSRKIITFKDYMYRLHNILGPATFEFDKNNHEIKRRYFFKGKEINELSWLVITSCQNDTE